MSEFSRETLLNIIETDHVQCGEASALARMALAAMDSEPVAEVYQTPNVGICAALGPSIRMLCALEPGTKLYLHAQPAPVVPENCVTAEHRRVIEMLLNVCGAAFELADDSCQQDVDGEECHVVPSDAFQKLSDALDEIENTLPTEDIDRPDVFLAWSAMPRAALKSLLHAQPAPVVPELRVDWQENEFSAGWNACRAAMLAAAPQSPGIEPATVPGKWIPVSERMPEVGVKVLCFPAEDEPIHAVFNGQLWLQDISWSNSDEPIDNVITCNVTHWVPLPASPQEVK
ncbi:DUF551 domain-containing protein [Klebsiella pneumoniae]|uniref:DUF551 domain-containing protein n=1 Tax=Klebsiella pneumoniae TaxID=573 RepID=UPI002A5ACF2E|nr:DUF551 domain-containing protein [Klebsiella pneumoniae]MDY0754878.1 DUF551 domain-containing protein [Klebsiella pneumoniae]MDY0806302.1 DUF551 domain-containing protein [Klebsiella pneumoniae]